MIILKNILKKIIKKILIKNCNILFTVSTFEGRGLKREGGCDLRVTTQRFWFVLVNTFCIHYVITFTVTHGLIIMCIDKDLELKVQAYFTRLEKECYPETED